MRAKDPRILTLLNEVLTAELTAINQYFLHSKLAGNWGFARLHKALRHESIDEMKHAELVTERILFLDGIPNLQLLWKLNIGETVEEQFNSDLALEYAAIERLNAGIALARELGDNGTRELLEKILVSEEQHVDWIETQLAAIERVGLQGYLAEQLKE